jgi:hypothetical protein
MELYKIHEDENFVFFSDIRTGKELMKIGSDGNLYLSGRIIQNSQVTVPKGETILRTKKRRTDK